MEAAMIKPPIFSSASASGFTGSADVRLFDIGAADAHRANIEARQRSVARERLLPKPDWLGMPLRIISEQSNSLSTFDAIQSLYLSTNRPRDRQIAERITELHRDVLAEGEQILPASLVQFTEFFLRHPNLSFPRITMTPDGTLRARWVRGPESFVAIEFTGRPLVKLVAEIPREGGQTAAYFASEPIDSVVPISRAIGCTFE
jgi:hypothetical protein